MINGCVFDAQIPSQIQDGNSAAYGEDKLNSLVGAAVGGAADIMTNVGNKLGKGDVVMFPTWLEHEVGRGKPTPNYPRISIALNFKLEEYGEYDEEGNGS